MNKTTLKVATLGEVGTFQAGTGFPPRLQGRPSGDLPFAKVGDISRAARLGKVLETAENYVNQADLAELRATPLPAGSIVFAKIGEAIRQNYRAFTTRELLIDNNVMGLIPDTARIDGNYLFRFLCALDFYKLAEKTTVPSIRKSKLMQVPIPLPPLEAQRRIAEVLDRAEALRAKRRAALAQLDSLTLAIFLGLFGDPATNPKGWRASTIGDVAEQVTDGEHLTPKRTTEGVKLLSARNIRDGYIDFENVDYIGSEEHERIRRRCDPSLGDILISCSGTIGRVASVETRESFSLVRSAALVRPRSSTIAYKFLEHYLRTPALKSHMVRRANASSQANLFQGQIRDLPVFVPPLHLQQDFARRIAAVEKLKTTYRTSLAELDALFASLQHRAFRGEL